MSFLDVGLNGHCNNFYQQNPLTYLSGWRRLCAGVLLVLSAFVAGPVLAEEECGIPDSDGQVICDAAGNPYADGIAYPDELGVTITLESDVAVTVDEEKPAVILHGSGPMTINAQLGSSITTLGDDSFGVLASSLDGPVTLTVDRVLTQGEDSNGLVVGSSGTDPDDYVSVHAVGLVATDGDSADAIFVGARAGDITVSASQITTTGDFSEAIDVSAVYGAGHINIEVSDTIITTGENSDGVQVEAAGNVDLLEIRVADILTREEDSDTIVVEALEVVDMDVVLTAETLATERDYSSGVKVNSLGGAISISAESITTSGESSEAIEIDSLSINPEDLIKVDVTGSLSTAASGAEGVEIDANAASVEVNLAGASTAGKSADIVELSLGSGSATVTASDTLFVSGDHSEAIWVASGGATYIDVLDVITEGLDGEGIEISGGGPVSVTARSINTLGDGAKGIYVESDGTGDHGIVDITVLGSLFTEGDINSENGQAAEGVSAFSWGGPISVNTGSISTLGNGAQGIEAESLGLGDDGTVQITANGDIETFGVGAAAISAFSLGGPITINAQDIYTELEASAGVHAHSDSGPVYISAGSVTTLGDGAQGIEGRSDGIGDQGAVDVTVRGSIFTQGELIDDPGDPEAAEAVNAFSLGGPIRVNLLGTISTLGTSAEGVRAESEGLGPDGSIDITAAGDIVTAGTDAEGIYAESAGGAITVLTTAAVRTLGDTSEGIQAVSESAGDISITSTQSIQTLGELADGVEAFSAGGDILINVGDVSIAGERSFAVQAEADGDDGRNGDITIIVQGEVHTANENSEGIWVEGNRAQILITETGSLGADQSWSIYSDVETLDHVEVRGRLAGSSFLGEGDDVLAFFDNADFAELGETFGGEGEDQLFFDGVSADFNGSLFHEFEQVTVTNGSVLFNIPGVVSIIEAQQINLVNGSTLHLGDGDGIRGQLFIDPTSRLTGWGDSPSSNQIVGDVMLNGTLDLAEGTADDMTTIVGNLHGADGVLALDVNFGRTGMGSADTLSVSGDADGRVILRINPVRVAEAGAPTGLLTFGGQNAGFDLAIEPLAVDGLGYGLRQNGQGYELAVDTVALEVSESVVQPLLLAPIDRSFFANLGARVGTGAALRRPGLEGGAVWMRVDGTTYQGKAGTSWAETTLDMDQHFAQLGWDLFHAQLPHGTFVGSFMTHYGEGDGRAEQQPGHQLSSKFSVESYGFGLGATWYGADDWYVDMTAMANWHSLDAHTQRSDAQTSMVGVELGTRYSLGKNLALVPWGQLVYSATNLDNRALSSALTTSEELKSSDFNSLEAKAMILLEIASGKASSVQIGAGLAHEFDGDSTTRFGRNWGFASDLKGASGEVAVRGQVQLSQQVRLFGDLVARHSFAHDFRSVEGLLGVRVDY